MADKYTHYGKEVTVQTLDHCFADDLETNGIAYIELPIVQHKIYKYKYQGKERYALVTYPNVPDAYFENVYITDSIPDDMDWEKLVYDCVCQSHGEEPAAFPTRARVLYDKACSMVYENDRHKDDKTFLDWISWKPDASEIDLALSALGSSLEELFISDHHDVPELDEL